MLDITSAWLRLVIEPEIAQFSLFNLDQSFVSIQKARISFDLKLHYGHRSIHISDLILVSVNQKQTDTPNGLLQYYTLSYQTKTGKYDLEVDLGLLQSTPLMLQRLALTNRSNSNVYPDRLIFCDLLRGNISLSEGLEPQPTVYVNGWQSWSPTGTYRYGERQRRSKLGLLTNPMISNPGTPITHRRNHFSSDMFTVLGDIKSQSGLIAGFLSQKLQFGSTQTRLFPEPTLSMWANGDSAEVADGQKMRTDWAAYGFIKLQEPASFAPYLQAVKQENEVKIPEKVPVGWCSWYEYFSKVTEQDIRDNLAKIVAMKPEIPLELLQIDDGYQKTVGDWLHFSPRFPEGVKPLAKEIRDAGLTPGLWMAPYILQAGTSIIREKPSWLLKNARGKPVNAGFGWNSLTRGLDLTVPEALDYTRQVIGTAVNDWGFPYLKLDFLYAAAISARYHDPTKTRAQVLRTGLETIREAAGPNAMLLGCGCPIGSALGLMDLMRISEDVAPTWAPEIMGISAPIKHEPSMPSVRNAFQNILARSELDQVWWGNDPDCLLVRPDSKLSLPEVQSLATVIGMTGGSMLLSDNLASLPPERLRIVQSFLPVLTGNPEVLDLFESAFPARIKRKMLNPSGPYYLLAVFNWQNSSQDLTIYLPEWGLPKGNSWLGREFWTGTIYRVTDELKFSNVPGHGVRLLAVHLLEEKPFYLGSDLHFSQGLELISWQTDKNSLRLGVDLNHDISGVCELYSPRQVTSITQNDVPLEWDQTEDGIIHLPVILRDSRQIEIQFSENGNSK